MRIHFYSFTALALCLFASSMYAQSWIYPETLYSFNPLMNTDRIQVTTFLPDINFWGEAGIHAMTKDDYHRWDVTVGGMVDLIGNQNWNFIFETNLHLIVDPNNNISFNPRSFIWEEGLLVGLKSGDDYWQFGYQHCCKHDVDNLELFKTTGREESRDLIYGSALARWERKKIRFDTWFLEPLAETHLYLLLQDQRFPTSTRVIEPNLEALLGAIRIRLTAIIPFSDRARAGVTGDIRFTGLGKNKESRFSGVRKIQTDPAIELFYDAFGFKALMRFFIRYAYQPDNFVTPIPTSSTLIAIGIRIFPISDRKGMNE